MKKLLTVLFVFTVLSAQADLVQRTWSSQAIYAYNWPNNLASTEPMPMAGDGIGWQIDIAFAGSFPFDALDSNVGTAANNGWYDGYGFYIDGFSFDAVEDQSVVMRMYNSTSIGTATSYMESLPLLLPDIEGIPPLGAFDVTFEFEAVPEPTTVALFGIGSLGLFLARRKNTDKKRTIG